MRSTTVSELVKVIVQWLGPIDFHHAHDDMDDDMDGCVVDQIQSEIRLSLALPQLGASRHSRLDTFVWRL